MGIREELHDALDQEGFPRPTLLDEAISRLDEPRPASGYQLQAIVAAFIALAVVATLLVVRANREALNPVGNAPNLPVTSAVAGFVNYQFVSPQVGWFMVFTPAGDTVLAKTTNGGQSWQKQLDVPGLGPTSLIHFFGDQQGVLVGQPNSASPAKVWRTTDGGSRWHSYQLPNSSGRLISADFFDSRRAWVLTTGTYVGPVPSTAALVYQSLDGGQSWSQLSSVNAGKAPFAGITFASATTGFLTTSSQPGWAPMFTTRDAGRTWAMLNLALPTIPAALFATFVQGPTFFSDGTGLVLVTLLDEIQQPCPSPSPAEPSSIEKPCHVYQPAGRYLYSSTNGGLNWSPPQPIVTLGNLDFVDSLNWVLLNGDSLSFTSDAGRTWYATRSVSVPSGWHITQAQFLDAMRGWIGLSDGDNNFIAVDGNGIEGTPPKFGLLGTADGGTTWKSVLVPEI